MEEYNKALREKLLNPQRMITDAYEHLRYLTPLSSSQVLTILESRKDTMKPEEYEKIIGFFIGIKDKISIGYITS
jgi:hypothetical protein